MECFLCKCIADKPDFKEKREKIKKFTPDILKSCQIFLKSRKHHKHKYSNVVLPNIISDDEIVGYHSYCYKEFNVKKQYLVDESALATSISTPSYRATSTEEDGTSRSSSDNISSRDAESSNFSEVSQETSVNVHEGIPGDSDNVTQQREVENEDDHEDFSMESFSNENNAEVCFFCTKISIKKNQRKIFCRQIKDKARFLATIKAYAMELNDLEMIEKISQELNNERKCTLCYHNACRLKYFSKFQTHKKKPETSGWSTTRDFNRIAREQVLQYIENEVVTNLRMLSLKFLEKWYVQYLLDLYEMEGVDCNNLFTTSHLKKNILESSLKDSIQIVSFSGQLYIIPAAIDIETVDDEEIEQIMFEEEAKTFALKYRSKILQIRKKKLPDGLDSDALAKGECDIPNWLNTFWKTVLGGVTRAKYRKNNKLERKSAVFSQDSIFAIHNGKIKPSKHILLGMSIKSLTGSRKVVDILNRHNYCISYTSIEELETSAAYSIAAKKQLCPAGIIRNPSLSSGVAWNNFDLYVETCSGKNTLHDCVGIMYQDIAEDNELNTVINNETDEILDLNVRNVSGRRKRSYEPEGLPIMRSAKQRCPEFRELPVVLTNSENLFSLSTVSGNIQVFQKLHFCWLLSHALQIQNTPMWTGYNAKIYIDNSEIQKVEYLIQINNSPTDPAVIKETMRRSLQIAAECDKKYFTVTYDLAIAKIALRIQAAEKEFEPLFIQFGSFHIMLSFFKAVGKFIDGSGLPNMLIDSGILAGGSLNSFLTGKHFNRCKKIHPILSLAIEILHFDSFLQNSDSTPYDVSNIKLYLEAVSKGRADHPQISAQEFNRLLTDYAGYRKDTLEGKHGHTAQVYLMYVQLIDYYLMLDYSVRTADVQLYKYVLVKVTNIFFSMNHSNYARYLTIHNDQLQNIEETHPGLLENCKSTFLGIRRTSKPFSRSPKDLTTEQTINADGASTSTGIIHLTNCFSSRERWSITHSLRTSVVSKLLDFLDLRSQDDTTKDLKKASIVDCNKKLDNLLSSITQITNPFSRDLAEDKLYNIGTGQSVSNEIYKFLSTVETEGEKQRLVFISETRLQVERFDRPITKNTVKNFAFKLTKRIKVNNKIEEVKIERNIFGQLFYVALKSKIDIKKILTHSLTPVPFSLCHVNGVICKTPKSMIVQELLSFQSSQVDAPDVQITIFDGFYFLHTLQRFPEKYSAISKHIFKMLVFEKKEVHIIFDKFATPSIKDYEHKQRGEDTEMQYVIKRENRRPNEFGKLLQSRNFKDSFVKFLIEDWKEEEFVTLCNGKIVKLNYDVCYVYKVQDNKMSRTVDYNNSCNHEEADTKIIHHICQLNANYQVKVRCTDSDIPVIMLANMAYLKADVEIFVDCSTSKKKNILHINDIYKNTGAQLSLSLAICHIFTGNDYNPSFYRKGKKRPFEILKKSDKYQCAFIELLRIIPSEISSSHPVFCIIEEYVCRMYSLKANDVDEGRLEVFDKHFCNKTKEVKLKKFVNHLDEGKKRNEMLIKKQLKGFDASSMPPTKQELLQQIKRTIYICSIWCNAHMRSPTELQPLNCGWTLINNAYQHYWFDGPQSPLLEDVTSDISDTESESDPEIDEAHYTSDSDEFSDASSADSCLED